MLRSLLPCVALCLGACLSAAHAAGLSPPDEASAERTEFMCKLTAQEQGLAGTALDSSVASCSRHRHLSDAALKDSVGYCMSRRQ